MPGRRGRPEVPNGLALCKIHHAAFDTHILGVRPSATRLRPNPDYLAERFEHFRAA